MRLVLLVVLSVAFVVTHLGMSHGAIRAGLVEKLGRWPFRGLYSLVSFVTLGGAVWVYARGGAQLGPRLWELPRAVVLGLGLPLMLLALIFFFLSLATPSPAGMMPARKQVHGVLRITRHPMNMAFALWGLVHVLASGYAGDVAFFGSFLVLGTVGAFHQDRRLLRERSASFTDFAHQTSVLPFVAIIRRRTRLAWAELSFPMILIATVLFAGMLIFHGRLFGIVLL